MVRNPIVKAKYGILAPGANTDETFSVSLRLMKRGDSITADFAGSDPQVAGPMNAPLTVTASGVYCALKMLAEAAIAQDRNEDASALLERCLELAPDFSAARYRLCSSLYLQNRLH